MITRHVGRVADDDVEGAWFTDCREQIGFYETNPIRDAVARGIAPRNLQRGGGDVGGHNFAVREFVRQGNCETAGACAHIGNFQRRAGGAGRHVDFNSARAETFERDFDDVFRFRARNEHGRRDFERQAPEFLRAGEVLRRFAGSPAGDEREIPVERARIERFFRMRVNPGAIAAENVHEKQLGGKRMRRNRSRPKTRHRFS